MANINNPWSDASAWIPIPDLYAEALIAYISAKILTQQDNNSENPQAVFYMNKYENECKRLEQEGVANKIDYSAEKDDRVYNDTWA